MKRVSLLVFPRVVVQDDQLMALKLKSPTMHVWLYFFRDIHFSNRLRLSLFDSDDSVGVGDR